MLLLSPNLARDFFQCSSKPVTFGELNESVAKLTDTPVTRKPRERALPGFFYFPLSQKDLRRARLRGKTLQFERDHSGSERNHNGYARTPNVSVQNSQTLWLRLPVELPLRLRSDPERHFELPARKLPDREPFSVSVRQPAGRQA